MQSNSKTMLILAIIAVCLTACNRSSLVPGFLSSSTKSPGACAEYLIIDPEELEFNDQDHLGECVKVSGDISYFFSDEAFQILMGSNSNRPLAVLMKESVTGLSLGDEVLVAGRVAGHDSFVMESGNITIQPFLEDAIILDLQQ